MTPEEIREKSATLAELYAAKANGKTLQFRIALDGPKQWIDHVDGSGPNLASEPCDWRVKPEPRRMWTVPTPHDEDQLFVVQTVWNQEDADHLKSCGYTVTEWQEVLPE